jgi:hypothetical protein
LAEVLLLPPLLPLRVGVLSAVAATSPTATAPLLAALLQCAACFSPPLKIACGGLCLSAQRVQVWSSGMILSSGAGGPWFSSQNSPSQSAVL